MTEEQMKVYDYITEIPEGVGGDSPNQVGNLINCERCGNPFQVAEVPTENECTYHWGRPYTTKANGMEELGCLHKNISKLAHRRKGNSLSMLLPAEWLAGMRNWRSCLLREVTSSPALPSRIFAIF